MTEQVERIAGTEEIQVAIEQQMREETREAYHRNLQKAQEAGREEGTAYAQRLLSLHTQAFTDAISTYISEESSRRGRPHVALKVFREVEPRKIAWMSLKVIVGRLHTRNLRKTTLALQLGRQLLVEIAMQRLKKEDKALFTGVLRATDKKSEQQRKEATALYMLDEAGVESLEKEHADDKLALHVGLKILSIAVEKLGLLRTELARKHYKRAGVLNTDASYVVYPTETLVEWIKQGHEVYQDMQPIYLPMVVPPVKWQSPTVGGYLTNAVRPLTMVKTRRKQYFKRLEQAEMPRVYEALNKIQETPWRINTRMLEIQKLVSRGNSGIGGFPNADMDTIPEKPADIDTNDEARREYAKVARRVHEDNVKRLSRCTKVYSTLATAERFAKYEAIYFPYQLDFRGRVYPVTQLSPQGEDFIKALLEFAEGEPLGTQQAADWLAIHIANLFGVDKVPFEERIQWTKDNSENLCLLASEPFRMRDFWDKADSPWQALAAAWEWEGYMKNGLAHVSRIPVALDGSCSGLQNFGMALKCEVTGAAVNLIPSDKPQDIYQRVIDKATPELVALIGEDWQGKSMEWAKSKARSKAQALLAEAGVNLDSSEMDTLMTRQYDEEGKVAERSPAQAEAYKLYWQVVSAYAWLVYGFNPATGKMSRKISKRSVMTFPYGSKEFGFRDQLREDIINPDVQDKGAASPFIECSWAASALMAKLLWEGVSATVVKAAEAMEWLQKAARLVAKEGQRVAWHTPLGFLVEQGYMAEKTTTVKTIFAGKEIQVDLPLATRTPDTRKQASGIAPNFVHALDASHLMLTVARSPDIKSWALIHDSFGTLPSRTQSLFNYVRVAFIELYTSFDVMEHFRDQLLRKLEGEDIEKLPSLPTHGNLDLNAVMHSKYCFA